MPDEERPAWRLVHPMSADWSYWRASSRSHSDAAAAAAAVVNDDMSTYAKYKNLLITNDNNKLINQYTTSLRVRCGPTQSVAFRYRVRWSKPVFPPKQETQPSHRNREFLLPCWKCSYMYNHYYLYIILPKSSLTSCYECHTYPLYIDCASWFSLTTYMPENLISSHAHWFLISGWAVSGATLSNCTSALIPVEYDPISVTERVGLWNKLPVSIIDFGTLSFFKKSLIWLISYLMYGLLHIPVFSCIVFVVISYFMSAMRTASAALLYLVRLVRVIA